MSRDVRTVRVVLFWLTPALFLPYWWLTDYWPALIIALAGPVLSLLIGLIDNLIFFMKRPFERREMLKLIHRWRLEMLRNKEVGLPNVNRTEERGGYEQRHT